MFSLSSWLHLRIPFSYFLMPVFLFAVSQSPNINPSRLGWVFLILHVLLYPASNGYNSYFDRDEGSIGGLRNPPPVRKGLYYLSLLFDAAALVLGVVKVSALFAAFLLAYGLASKGYSHPAVRFKKYPWTGWLVAGLFQGLVTYVMSYIGLNGFGLEQALRWQVFFPGLLCTLMLWANYPLTQVYQHEEDLRRGDRTLSSLLGIRGTFFLTLGVFGLAAAGFIYLFVSQYGGRYIDAYLLAQLPIAGFFFYWFYRVYSDASKANFANTMWMNLISSTAMNAFFIYLFLHSTQVLDAV
jgi:1,4-dihydroxy-2-naphthoate octaprenyltransferase